MKIELVAATQDDFDFAFEAKRRAMGPYVAAKWGWDDAQQLRCIDSGGAKSPGF